MLSHAQCWRSWLCIKSLLVLCLLLLIPGCKVSPSESEETRTGGSVGTASGANLSLVFRLREPVNDPEMAWRGYIEFASWIDDECFAYSSRGDVVCVSAKAGRVQWVVHGVGKIKDWSVSPGTKRLAILHADSVTSIIDGSNGKIIFTADQAHMAKVLGLNHAVPSCLAISPTDGRLIFCTSSTYFGRNAYMLDSSYTKVLSSFDMDGFPSKLSVSPNGRRAAVIAMDEVLCVTDMFENREVFFQGKRIMEKPIAISDSIDSPFFSHLCDSGDDILVYSLDNSWATGDVFVHNLESKEVFSFDGLNGHIELDVSFETRLIALTGTSTHLSIFDLNGKVIAHKANASTKRNIAVDFSPSADRVLVASFDNSLSVYSITEASK